jgi:hypothetical protein
MQELDKEGLTERDLVSLNIENQIDKQQKGLGEYYNNFYKLHENEKDNPILAQPFSLYSNTVRLNTFDRLNTLERETVRYYKGKLDKNNEKLLTIKSIDADVG